MLLAGRQGSPCEGNWQSSTFRGTGPVEKRTVVADRPVYCPDGKSGPSILWLGPSSGWGGLLLEGSTCGGDCGGMRMRFRRSGAGWSRRMEGTREKRVYLRTSSEVEFRATSSNRPPDASIWTTRPAFHGASGRASGVMMSRFARGLRRLLLLSPGGRRWRGARSSPSSRIRIRIKSS